MIFKTTLLFLGMISCQESKVNPTLNSTLKNKTVQLINQTKSEFSGNFYGVNNQKEIYINLTVVKNTQNIKGVLIMDGQKAQIAASENKGICKGFITEEDSQKIYEITAEIKEGKLYFNITFPEYNNQILALVLERNTKTNDSEINKNPSTSKTLDNAVIGKWRFTEVLSSGSGEFYSSFSTDYFVKINADGTATTWTGKSAGGSNTVIIDGDYGTNVRQYNWFTNSKTFHFIDTETNKEEVVNYYAEPSRMMFSFGNNKRVYQRIN